LTDGSRKSGGVEHEMETSGEFLILPMPDDFHVHLRQGEAMALYARRHAGSFGRAMVMPNTIPPIADAVSLIRYRDEISSRIPSGSDFIPLMTFKLLPGLSGATVAACAGACAVAGKYYPAGATTNASDGPSRPDDVKEALDAMQELDIVLSIHGEDPEFPAMEREAAFLPTVERILGRWPKLRVVLEHLSTKEAVDFVRRGPDRLAATITAHHLLFTIDDMLGEGLNPHLFCKPILKTAVDRDALVEAALSGSPKFFFGSDSAPHPRPAKERASAPGGIYSSPTAIPALAELFESKGYIGALEAFVARFGAKYYRLSPPGGELRLRKESWTVPVEIDGVVPMCAGATMEWKIA